MIKSSRATGWFLLFFGLGIIIWTFYSSYNIFTGKAAVPEIFEMDAIAEPKEPSLPPKEPTTPQGQMEQMLQEQIGDLLPVDTVPRLLNLIAWSIFAGIMTFGGAQVASLGIKLIK